VTLVSVVLSVTVVVLAVARGTMAPRRTMRCAAAVGMHDWVVVDFLVTVLYETVLIVIEAGLTVVVLVLVGCTEMVVLTVVDTAFAELDLVIVTVDPSLWVIVVALGVDVNSAVTVLVVCSNVSSVSKKDR
jgi:hypothetical protein